LSDQVITCFPYIDSLTTSQLITLGTFISFTFMNALVGENHFLLLQKTGIFVSTAQLSASFQRDRNTTTHISCCGLV